MIWLKLDEGSGNMTRRHASAGGGTKVEEVLEEVREGKQNGRRWLEGGGARGGTGGCT